MLTNLQAAAASVDRFRQTGRRRGRHAWVGNGTRSLAAVALLLGAGGCATPEPVVVRGFADHRTVEQVNRRTDCEIAVLPADATGRIGIRATEMEQVTLRETVYYEKLLEYKNPGEQDPSKIRRVPVQGEFLTVPGDVKTERREVGPLGNAACLLNGVSVVLDAQGEYRDQAEILLSAFDQKGLGEKTEIHVTGEFPVQELKKELILSRRELLDALGVPWDASGGTSGDGLVATVSWLPEKPKRGGALRITLTVENRGDRAAAKVVGRTFSRQAWLNGRNFYLGTLPPGETRSFSRTFTVPTALAEPSGVVFAALGMWNLNAGEKLGKAEGPVAELQIPVTP